MSNPPQASLMKQNPQQSTQAAEKRYIDTMRLEEVVIYKCTCGTPHTSENWICCDDDDCLVGWYHLECVRLTEVPPGDWLCPRCSLKPMNHARSLLQAKMSMSSKPGKTVEKVSDDTSDRDDKEEEKDKKSRPAKKGIAVIKSTPKKKAGWIGWVETGSNGEHKHKGHEDASHKPLAVAEGKRTKDRTINSKSRMTRSQASTSNLAARLKKVMAESGGRK